MLNYSSDSTDIPYDLSSALITTSIAYDIGIYDQQRWSLTKTLRQKIILLDIVWGIRNCKKNLININDLYRGVC